MLSTKPAVRPSFRQPEPAPWAVSIFDLLAPLYHPIFRRLTDDHADAVRHVRAGPDDLVLDLGGGTGIGANAVIDATGCRAVVADRSAAMLRHSPQRPELHRVQADAASLPFPRAVFAAILCLDAMHHFQAPDRALLEMRRVLRPGGVLVVEELNGDSPWARGLVRLERWAREPGRLWSPLQLRHLLAETGFTVREVRSTGLVTIVAAVLA